MRFDGSEAMDWERMMDDPELGGMEDGPCRSARMRVGRRLSPGGVAAASRWTRRAGKG